MIAVLVLPDGHGAFQRRAGRGCIVPSYVDTIDTQRHDKRTNPWWLDKRVQSENRQYGGRRPVWRLGRAMAEALLYRLHVAAHVRSSPEVVYPARGYRAPPAYAGLHAITSRPSFYVSGPSK